MSVEKKIEIQKRRNIKLLNCSTSSFCTVGSKKEYLFEGAKDGSPVTYYFDWEEIDGINSRCSAIKTGALAFIPEDRAEGYAALNLFDWETTIMFDETIADIIANPTISNLERVLNIRDIHTIERFRGKMLSYINTGHGVDSRFIEIVNGRFKEINSGIMKSNILLKPNVDYSVTNEKDIADLKNKNTAMEKELADMKAMMATLLEQKNAETKKSVKSSAKASTQTAIVTDESDKSGSE